MTSRFATLVFGTLLILVASATGSLARNYTVSMGKGSVTIDFPKSFDVSDIDRGVEAKTGDEEVYVWAEAYTEAQVDKIMDEHGIYFSKQGVAVTGKIKTETRMVNGVSIKMLDVPATWHGDRTVVQYLLIDPGWPSGWKLMLTEWASPKGDKMYQKDLDTIMNGLTFNGK